MAEDPAVEDSDAAASTETAPDPAPTVQAPKPVTLTWAREFLQSNPDASAAAAEAERFAAAGEDSAAFLLTRYAARQGDAQAAAKTW